MHQKALEVYNHIFSIIGKDGLSRDLPLYLPGLASVLSFASLSVRTPFLDLLERHFLHVHPRSLRPAMKSLVLALLPGLEEETSEDFDRTLKLMERFKAAIRPADSQDITSTHSTGDNFFWQCFFLAAITGHTRRTGALAYLVRSLPELGHALQLEGHKGIAAADPEVSAKLTQLVTSPEPGLLIRCFTAGLADDQLLIQRGYLDLLVTHLPLHSKVLQVRAKKGDLELLLRAAVGVTIRRDMSLNRRLWTWLLGPEPPASQETEGGMESPLSTSSHAQGYFASRTSYFEEFGLQPLTRALLAMIKSNADSNPAEIARPYRICLSLMDRWEIGGLIVPEVFLPVVDSVRAFKAKADKSDFVEVLRSASVFFDGVESGLIYSEILTLVAQAISPGALLVEERTAKLELVNFILANFNVREEEMITIHAPLTVLSILCMAEEAKEAGRSSKSSLPASSTLPTQALAIAASLLELVPERAFLVDAKRHQQQAGTVEPKILAATPNAELLKKIRTFYVADQGNLEATSPPFAPQNVVELLLQKACNINCESLGQKECGEQVVVKSRIIMLLLSKAPAQSYLDTKTLLGSLHGRLSSEATIPFTTYSSILSLSTHLYSSGRISHVELSELVTPLVRHAWGFLSGSEPKYHVETVRGLWVLQTALTPSSRDIEAAIASLMLENDIGGTFSQRPSDPGRSFCVLWSHSLQDNPSGADRRGPKTPNGDLKAPPRLAGMDNYEVMLTRPLFLMLDALVDERTQLFMTVKTWISSLPGIDKLFAILVSKFAELSFLRRREGTSAAQLRADDDIDLVLYYIRTLSHVFRWAPNSTWGTLAKKTIRSTSYFPPLSEITGTDEDITYQEFFLQVALRCMSGDKSFQEEGPEGRVTQLYRSALTLLNQILLNPYAEPLSKLHLETPLIDKLMQSLTGPDPYVQVLLLDVVFASLRLREMLPVELPSSPTNEKRPNTADPTKGGGYRLSLTGEKLPVIQQPPPMLLKCILAGLSSASSRPVLDSWIGFLSECLPLYSESIFQVLIPLVETLCAQIADTFKNLQQLFRSSDQADGGSAQSVVVGPETTLISLLNGLEHVLAKGHDRLLAEEARAQVVKSPEQPQGFFGNMVSGVFSSDAPQSRSATANDRLTVLLAFQDAVRICFTIWSWGQGSDSNLQDVSSGASFTYTSLRMRNRARRLLEHLFAAETLECLETVIGIWRDALDTPDSTRHTEVFNLLPALDGSRPKHTIPALFNAIYSRTNPSALEPSRRSTLTIELQDTDVVIFLVDYARSLEDDAMDEIWHDCMLFLKDLLGNPFPHRQALPSLLEFAAILGEKVDNTNFGEQRKMRRDLAVSLFFHDPFASLFGKHVVLWG